MPAYVLERGRCRADRKLSHPPEPVGCAALSLIGSLLCPSWPGSSHITGVKQEHSVILTSESAAPKTGRSQIREPSGAWRWDTQGWSQFQFLYGPQAVRAVPGPQSPCQTPNSQGILNSRGRQQLTFGNQIFLGCGHASLCLCHARLLSCFKLQQTPYGPQWKYLLSVPSRSLRSGSCSGHNHSPEPLLGLCPKPYRHPCARHPLLPGLAEVAASGAEATCRPMAPPAVSA